MLSSHEIYSRYTESRSRTREGKERKRNWGNWKKENKNYGERTSAVITSAALNGGISQCLWHNFMGFTMAYIRGPAERISPRGIHICPTVTFVPLLLVLYFHPFHYSYFLLPVSAFICWVLNGRDVNFVIVILFIMCSELQRHIRIIGFNLIWKFDVFLYRNVFTKFDSE